MGVLKNDVGRPSNKTIRIRMALKVILLIVVVGLVFAAGYLLNDYQNKDSNNEVNIEEKSESKDLTINSQIVKMLYGYFNNDDLNMFAPPMDDFYTEKGALGSKLSDEYMLSIAASNINTKTCENEYYDIEGCYDATKLLEKVKEIFGVSVNLNEESHFGLACNGYSYSIENNEFYVDGGLGTTSSFIRNIYDVEILNNELYLYEVVAIYDWVEDGTIWDLSFETEIKIGEELTKENIIKYKDKFEKFKWIFTKDNDNNYIFDSVEKVN